MGAIRQLLTNENSRNAAFASPGKQVVTRDTRLRGFYRLDGTTCSAYYCQADCRDPLGRRKTIRRRIDDVQLIDVDDARNRARLLIAKIKAGEFFDDGEGQHDVTLEEAWGHYLATRDLSIETHRSYRKSLKNVLADYMDVPLRNLSETAAARKLVAARHAEETEQRGPYQANRAFQALRAVYNHARKSFDGLPEMPPTALVRFNKETRYQVGDDVLPLIWEAHAKIDSPISKSLSAVILLTGGRPIEVSQLRWQNVDLERRTAFIEKTKSGRSFEYILSTPAVEYLKQARFDDDWVFPGVKQCRDYRVPSMPVPVGKFRNVYQAVAKKIHVDDLFLKMLVNHKLTDVTHGYAGQRSILLDTLIAEQERISAALSARKILQS
ncbi:MAG: tyrosine-type recombinase/integrase [Pseudomonadota bacterium]